MRLHVLVGASLMIGVMGAARAAPFMIVGNDEKLLWDEQFKPVLSPPGRDSVLIVDLADPLNPNTIAELPLKNSVVGPPTNVAIDPTNSVALVATPSIWSRTAMSSSKCPTTRSMSSTSRRTRPRLSPLSQWENSLPVLASIRPVTSPSSPIATTNRSACSRSREPT